MNKALCLLALIFLAGCDTAPQATSVARSGATSTSFAQGPADRPGLGTKWGEDRVSHVQLRNFVRATPNSPSINAAIRYDDAAGIRAMMGAAKLNNRAIDFSGRSGLTFVAVGLQDEQGRFLPTVRQGERAFVVGEEGQRYRISLINNADTRIEVVLSVDGLDVVDGRRASWRKRGYLVGPHEHLAVEGFRQSLDKVAAFRFGPVRESYAHEKYHNTSNVGVIGVAVFDERGSIDPRREKEAKRRLEARPFAQPAY